MCVYHRSTPFYRFLVAQHSRFPSQKEDSVYSCSLLFKGGTQGGTVISLFPKKCVFSKQLPFCAETEICRPFVHTRHLWIFTGGLEPCSRVQWQFPIGELSRQPFNYKLSSLSTLCTRGVGLGMQSGH